MAVFEKGWKGGPGRPPKRREDRILSAMDTVITDDDWLAIIEVAKSGALQGQFRKLELLLAYGLGKPTQTVNVRNDTNVIDEALAAMQAEDEEAKAS